MNLYNECFEGVESLISSHSFKKLKYTPSPKWEDVGQNQLIFQKDMAYELGSSKYPAISSIALTDSAESVPEDEIYLCGKDINEIKADTPFARIALIRVNSEGMGSGDKLYQTIRKIEYTRYHFNPDGYMIRISALSHRESARISKKAVKNGLDFATVGSMFIDAYKKQPQVEAVKLIFVTDVDFPYNELDAVMQKSEKITKALDHIMRDLKMDCHSCKLKDVCEEVEKLVEGNDDN